MKETKKHSSVRYLLLLIFIFLYGFYSINKFGLKKGLLVSLLTWSFFVFCTPIADAGFLLAFPVRLLVGVRMIYTQFFSFLTAFFVTFFAVLKFPLVFQKTLILKLYHEIIFNPFPYWGVVILSFAGTLLSIYFGDELIDVSTHSKRKKYHKHLNKYKIIVSFSVFLLTILFYDLLLRQTGIAIPLL